jgi:hypothetical protein
MKLVGFQTPEMHGVIGAKKALGIFVNEDSLMKAPEIIFP